MTVTGKGCRSGDELLTESRTWAVHSPGLCCLVTMGINDCALGFG